MKVYIASWTSGERESRIFGIYSTKEEADKCRKRINKAYENHWDSYASVKEFTLDERERGHEKYEDVEVVEERKDEEVEKVDDVNN